MADARARQSDYLTQEQGIDYLAIVKSALRESSEKGGTVQDLGILSGGEHEALWSGAISLRQREASGEVTISELTEVVPRLAGSFIPIAKGAAKRCVDGSSVVGYEDSAPADFGRQLGPQVQGGTVDETITMRLLHGFGAGESASLLKDMDTFAQRHQSDFAPGDHTDNHADETMTGCGAIDGQLRKLAMYGDGAKVQTMESIATSIMALGGKRPPAGMLSRLQTSAAMLLQRPDYFPSRPQSVLDKLRRLNPGGVEKLARPHGEVSLTINFVPGTTFHRDHYNAMTGAKLQNFNLDAWTIFDEYDDEAFALFIDAAATLMDLTDGSLRLFARLPRGTGSPV